MTATSAPALSAECTLAREPGYDHVHDMCRQTKDVLLPHSTRIVLVPRCICACHQDADGTP